MTTPFGPTPDERQIVKVATRIAPMLHGIGPQAQGAVRADLTATWLAGVQGPDSEQARREILLWFVSMVRELIPINEKAILEMHGRAALDEVLRKRKP